MKRLQRQQASNCVEEQSLERLCAESLRTRDASQRRFPYTTATKSASFVAITPSPAPAAQRVSPPHTMSKLFTKDDEELLTEPRWGQGVGWVGMYTFLVLCVYPAKTFLKPQSHQ